MNNVQSFIDDMDSLRRKRQKFNNSPSALVFKHVAETEKRVRNHFTFNIVKAEPADQHQMSFGVPDANATRGFILQPVTKEESNTLRNPRIKVSPGRTPSPMECSNTFYSPQQQHSPQYQPNIQPIVQNEPIDRLSPLFGGAAAAGTYTLPLSVMNHQQNIMPGNLRTQVSPGRTSTSIDYDTAYSPPNMQQQSPQYQPNISPMMQMPTENLYSYAPEQARLQQMEPNPFVLGKTQEDMSYPTENQGPVLQPLELNNANTAIIPDVTVGHGLLDMDSQQLDWHLNSTDLADLGLCANLSSGLSLTDDIQPTTSNAEEISQTNSMTNSMTEETKRISWIKQELSEINNIFKPNRRNDDGGFA